MSTSLPQSEAEWLEPDGLGGFASGTVSGVRTRRYHGLLVPATFPPAGRSVLVNGFEARAELLGTTFAISSQRYSTDVVYPDGANRLAAFRSEPWPTWTFELGEGIAIEQEFFAVHGSQTVALSWRLAGEGSASAKLRVRPLLSGRDFHSTHHENSAFQFQPNEMAENVIWHPYPDLPGVEARTNGTYRHNPCWYRNFLYIEEQRRGLDCTEDLASPGVFEWEITTEPAVLIFSAQPTNPNPSEGTLHFYDSLRYKERSRRYQFSTPQRLAADAYIVKRGQGRTIIAGYPWFGDWGRDAFIALRGLCLASGRLEDARDILVQWSSAVSEGMLPNRFPDHGETPEYNSVDASLWYIVAVYDYVQSCQNQSPPVALSDTDRQKLQDAVDAILTGYGRVTRFGIKVDDDGLLSCGQPGVQLTWMDAKVGDRVVTPRIGKPVEVQALWLNALWIGSQFRPDWKAPFDKGKASFVDRFWNEAAGGLFDVIDCDHKTGVNDGSIRPNQIFAIGGLPLQLLEGERADRVLQTVEANLLTPIGLRSLPPKEPAYVPHYEGGVRQRDGSYHQGTVWPWLIGPFVEAWLRVRRNTPEARAEARARFLPPLRDHFREAGLNHISEIADAESPYAPKGCPFQAWSMGEYLRLLSILR
jgi:predicted glycogen debranching enzyme